VELEKTAGSRWTCFGVRVPSTLGYTAINFNLRSRAPYDHNARPSQTDRQTDGQTDEHHGKCRVSGMQQLSWLSTFQRSQSVFIQVSSLLRSSLLSYRTPNVRPMTHNTEIASLQHYSAH